jgi:hypothetical protein
LLTLPSTGGAVDVGGAWTGESSGEGERRGRALTIRSGVRNDNGSPERGFRGGGGDLARAGREPIINSSGLVPVLTTLGGLSGTRSSSVYLVFWVVTRTSGCTYALGKIGLACTCQV